MHNHLYFSCTFYPERPYEVKPIFLGQYTHFTESCRKAATGEQEEVAWHLQNSHRLCCNCAFIMRSEKVLHTKMHGDPPTQKEVELN